MTDKLHEHGKGRTETLLHLALCNPAVKSNQTYSETQTEHHCSSSGINSWCNFPLAFASKDWKRSCETSCYVKSIKVIHTSAFLRPPHSAMEIGFSSRKWSLVISLLLENDLDKKYTQYCSEYWSEWFPLHTTTCTKYFKWSMYAYILGAHIWHPSFFQSHDIRWLHLYYVFLGQIKSMSPKCHHH